jgi:hypothetical protein
MKRKIKDILKLLFSDRYLLVSKTSDDVNFSYTMNDYEVKKYSLFIHNFLIDGDSAIDEVNQILNP